MALRTYLGGRTLGVLADYHDQGVVHHIGLVYPQQDDTLRVFFPKGHVLAPGALVTLHLDNRTGVDLLDAELRVYRTSYKGRVVRTKENWVVLEPVEYVLMHGHEPVENYREPGYEFPVDSRPNCELPITPLQQLGPVQAREHDNKIGILTTLAANQPHTTVLAFLNTEEDDVFLISIPGTFKLQQLKRNRQCFFTIDERAKFIFDEAIDWNYTILEAEAFQVPATHPVYEQVRTEFLVKSPWEAGFFLMEGQEMIHLKSKGFVFAGEPCRVRQAERFIRQQAQTQGQK